MKSVVAEIIKSKAFTKRWGDTPYVKDFVNVTLRSLEDAIFCGETITRNALKETYKHFCNLVINDIGTRKISVMISRFDKTLTDFITAIESSFKEEGGFLNLEEIRNELSFWSKSDTYADHHIKNRNFDKISEVFESTRNSREIGNEYFFGLLESCRNICDAELFSEIVISGAISTDTYEIEYDSELDAKNETLWLKELIKNSNKIYKLRDDTRCLEYAHAIRKSIENLNFIDAAKQTDESLKHFGFEENDYSSENSCGIRAVFDLIEKIHETDADRLNAFDGVMYILKNSGSYSESYINRAEWLNIEGILGDTPINYSIKLSKGEVSPGWREIAIIKTTDINNEAGLKYSSLYNYNHLNTLHISKSFVETGLFDNELVVEDILKQAMNDINSEGFEFIDDMKSAGYIKSAWEDGSNIFEVYNFKDVYSNFLEKLLMVDEKNADIHPSKRKERISLIISTKSRNDYKTRNLEAAIAIGKIVGLEEEIYDKVMDIIRLDNMDVSTWASIFDLSEEKIRKSNKFLGMQLEDGLGL